MLAPQAATSAIYSPGGDTIYTIGDGRGVFAWDAATGELISTYRVPATKGNHVRFYDIAVSPDNSHIASVSAYRQLHVWNTSSEEQEFEVEIDRGDYGLEFNADGSEILTVSGRYTVSFVVSDVSSGDTVRTFDGGTMEIVMGRSFAFCPDSLKIAALAKKGIAIFDYATGELVKTMSPVNYGDPVDVAFSPDGQYIASAHELSGTVSVIYLWDAATGDSLKTMTSTNLAEEMGISRIEFSADGNSIYGLTEQSAVEAFAVTPNESNTRATIDYNTLEYLTATVVKQWDVATGDSIGVIGPMFASDDEPDLDPLAVSPDGQRIVTAGRTNPALPSVWDVSTGQHLFDLGVFSLTDMSTKPALLTSGAVQVSIPFSNRLAMIDVATGELDTVCSFTGTAPVLSPDGSKVLTSGAGYFATVNNPKNLPIDGLHARLVLSDVATGDSLRDFTVAEENTTELFHWITEGGSVIAVGMRRDPLDDTLDRPTAWRWDAETGALVDTIYLYNELAGMTELTEVVAAAISPDESKLAVASKTRLELWNIAKGTRIRSIDVSGDGLRSNLLFNSNGHRVMFINDSPHGGIQVRNASTGDSVSTIESSSTGTMIALALSPDGLSIAVGFEDATPVEIYAVGSGQLLGSFDTFETEGTVWDFDVYSVMITPDASQVVAFLRDEIQIWDLDTDLVGDLTAIRGNANPTRFALAQNAPNPFNPSTTIQFTLPEAGNASLAVFNITGQHVRTLTEGNLAAGIHEVTWDGLDGTGRAVGSGVYLYRLTWTTPGATGTGSETAVRRMTYIR